MARHTYEVTDEVLARALANRDGINKSYEPTRTDEDDWMNDITGQVGEVLFAELVSDLYGPDAELKDESQKWDWTLRTPRGTEHKIEVKTYREESLAESGLSPDEANLLACRTSQAYADKYVMAIWYQGGTLEFVGVADRETVERSPRKKICENSPKFVERSKLNPIPSP